VGPASCAARRRRPGRLLHQDRSRGHQLTPQGRRCNCSRTPSTPTGSRL
jgi:hypothetical protein